VTCFGGLGKHEISKKINHVNIKMPDGLIITIPKKGELKSGLLKDAISKANLTEEEFKGMCLAKC
jgi:predicted RNA binding protein YcfA (HicA-like mRNA interferase family)